MSESRLEGYFFTTLFIGVILLVCVLLYPFLGALALAVVLATLAIPLHDYLVQVVKRESLAAVLVVSAITLAVLLPALGLSVLLVEEVRGISHDAAMWDTGTMPTLVRAVEGKIATVFPSFRVPDPSALLKHLTENVGAYLAPILAGTADIALKLVVAIIALYYFLRDGHRFVGILLKLSPLRDEEDQLILRRLRAVTVSLVRGTLVIACIQGALIGIGFLLFNIPNPILWGSVAAVGALIPSVGTGLVAVPALLYLAFLGKYGALVGFAAWSFLFVGLIDNVLRPKLIGSGASIHPLGILLSVLGGIAVFGVSGFLLGPLAFGLMVALFDIYSLKVAALPQEGV